MICHDLLRQNILDETKAISTATQIFSEFSFSNPPKIRVGPKVFTSFLFTNSSCLLKSGSILSFSLPGQPVVWSDLLIAWALTFPIAITAFWLFSRKLMRMQEEAINAVEVVISKHLGLGPQLDVDLTKRGLVSRLINSDIPILALIKEYIERQRFLIRGQTQKLVEARSRAEIGEFAAQVAHDISTPIEVISRAFDKKTPSDEAAVLASIRSLRESVDDITARYKSLRSNSPHTTVFKNIRTESVSTQINLVVGQMKNIWPEVSFDLRIDGDAPVKMNATAFQSAIRNILTNAVEAIGGVGRVVILVGETNSQVEISIRDEGPGIAKEIQEAIFEREKTFKPSGSGLGLFQAKQAIERIGGNISVVSSPGSGATFTVSIPKVEINGSAKPDKILIAPSTKIVIVDDDRLAHYTWRKALERVGKIEQVSYFFTVGEFKKWFSTNNPATNTIFFFDLQIKEGTKTESGLNLIKELQLEPHSYLVTGLAFKGEVSKMVNETSVRMLDKIEIPNLSFESVEDFDSVELVLIDDDPANHMLWKREAEAQSKKVATFLNFGEFLKHQHLLSRSAEVYVDWIMGKVEVGDQVARAVRNLGFKSIKIATSLADFDLGKDYQEFEVVTKFHPFDRRPQANL